MSIDSFTTLKSHNLYSLIIWNCFFIPWKSNRTGMIHICSLVWLWRVQLSIWGSHSLTLTDFCHILKLIDWHSRTELTNWNYLTEIEGKWLTETHWHKLTEWISGFDQLKCADWNWHAESESLKHTGWLNLTDWY